MELKLNAVVYCNDETQAGRLNHVLLERGTYRLDNIVVALGLLGGRSLILPAQDIGEVSDDGGRIDLRIGQAELNSRTEYIPTSFVTANPEGGSYNSDAGLAPIPVGVPFTPSGVGASGAPTGIGAPALIYPVGTDLVETGASVVQPQVDVNSSVPTLKDGTRVADNADDNVGGVVAIQLDGQNRLQSFTVKEGFIFTHQVTMPAAWIDAIGETTVSLKYSKDEVKNMLDNPNANVGLDQNPPVNINSATMPITPPPPPYANSNPQMRDNGPLTPATNPIADQIAGDTQTPNTGSDTPEQGENLNAGLDTNPILPLGISAVHNPIGN